MSTLAEQFTSVVAHANFMTPKVIGYYKITNGVAELATGPKFLSTPMFGVTIVQNGKQNHELSKCFHDQTEAMKYIKTL